MKIDSPHQTYRGISSLKVWTEKWWILQQQPNTVFLLFLNRANNIPPFPHYFLSCWDSSKEWQFIYSNTNLTGRMSTGQYHFSVWIINSPILNNTGIYLCCSILQNQLCCYLRAQLWYLLVLEGLSWTLKQSNQERIRWEGRGEATICPRLSQWGREEQIVSKFHIHDLGHWRRFQVCFHSIHFFLSLKNPALSP